MKLWNWKNLANNDLLVYLKTKNQNKIIKLIGFSPENSEIK